MADRLEFLQGVAHLHAFYTEQVRMLAHAYSLTDEEAATMLDQYGYFNVARSILRPARIRMTEAQEEHEIRGRDGDDAFRA